MRLSLDSLHFFNHSRLIVLLSSFCVWLSVYDADRLVEKRFAQRFLDAEKNLVNNVGSVQLRSFCFPFAFGFFVVVTDGFVFVFVRHLRLPDAFELGSKIKTE